MGPTRLTDTVPGRVWSVVVAAVLALLVATTALVTAPDDQAGEADRVDPVARPEIVGGRAARPGEYPFAVALLHHGTRDRYQAQFCGGSLIGPDLVLTAAHCVAAEAPTSVDALVGTHDLLQGGRRLRADRIHVHPAYEPSSSVNDVAVVELRAFVDEPVLVTALGAEEGELAAPGRTATTVGWGSTTSGGYPTRLRTVDVPLVSDASCRASYGRLLVEEVMVCAGYADGGRDACGGDSGGPLLVRRDDGWRQVGVVSWGSGCALPELPGVYAELAGLRDFLDPFLHGFRDVPRWAADAIAWLTDSGIAQGFPDRTFRPHHELTRAQAVQLLFAIVGPPLDATAGDPQPFSDVPSWIDQAVRWAARDPDGEGPRSAPMAGYPDGTFRPDEPMRRAAFSRLLWRLAGEPDAGPHPFVDVGPWAAPAVAWMAEQGQASGWPDGTFRPRSPLTRAQAARMLHRMHGPG